MKDPVFKKLKEDAGFVLNELILAVTHRTAPKEWRHPRENPPMPEMSMTPPSSPPSSGLCYFHLN